jgi:protein-disulfide isomerase
MEGKSMTGKESPIHLSQPVGKEDHALGSADADATLVEYGDFECPYSKEGTQIASRLQEEFKGRLRFVFRNFPLDKHPHAQHAADGAEAAAAQGKFWEMAEMLFANQGKLTDRDLLRYADKLGLDTAKFKQDLSEHAHAERVRVDVLSGRASKVTGTPTFFINNQFYDGADDIETLRTVLSRHLQN